MCLEPWAHCVEFCDECGVRPAKYHSASPMQIACGEVWFRELRGRALACFELSLKLKTNPLWVCFAGSISDRRYQGVPYAVGRE